MSLCSRADKRAGHHLQVVFRRRHVLAVLGLSSVLIESNKASDIHVYNNNNSNRHVSNKCKILTTEENLSFFEIRLTHKTDIQNQNTNLQQRNLCSWLGFLKADQELLPTSMPKKDFFLLASG